MCRRACPVCVSVVLALLCRYSGRRLVYAPRAAALGSEQYTNVPRARLLVFGGGGVEGRSGRIDTTFRSNAGRLFTKTSELC